jgi:hypothetical protein
VLFLVCLPGSPLRHIRGDSFLRLWLGLLGELPSDRRDECRDDRPHVGPKNQGVNGSQDIDRDCSGLIRIRAMTGHLNHRRVEWG